MIGAVDYHKLEHSREDPLVPGDFATSDLSTMPAIGIAGQYAMGGTAVEFGMDGGVLVSWDREEASFISTGPGMVVVWIDRGLLVVDGLVGLYLSTTVADSVRLYGAGGASVMWGDADYRDEVRRHGDSAFGLGVYARAGVEMRLRDSSFMGVGIRWVATELEFDAPIGDVDVEGWQAFLTYTVGF